MVKVGICTFLVALCVSAPLSAQVADTVILRSGNPVVGEVQHLKRGSLFFDTDEMDVVEIDWDEIAVVRSGSIFEVTLSSGEQFYGSLAGAASGMLVVVGAGRSDTVAFRDVIAIEEIEQGFFARTNGFIDLGTNVTRANKLRSLLMKGRFNYRGVSWGLNVTGESYWQRQASVSDAGDTTVQRTSRNESSVAVTRYLGARWQVGVKSQVEQNQELELDRRFLGGLGGGYQIVQSRGLEWTVGAGGTVNLERYTGEEGEVTGELVTSTTFDAFDVGDVDVYTSVTSYATPAGGGRFRINVDARVAWEIFSDFTVGINVTERFDSRPPSTSAAKRDYQYTISVGWSWS